MLTAYGFEVVKAVDNAPMLLDALVQGRPDVAVVDVRLPPGYTDEGHPEVISQLLSRHSRDEPLGELTPREREVLGLMAEGLPNIAIAARFQITDKAIGKHTNNIFAKLGLPPSDDHNRRVLAVLAYLQAAPKTA